MSGLVGLSHGVHGIGRSTQWRNDHDNNGTVVVSTCSGRAGGCRSWCFVVGRLRHKQASWSHCNINQSCSALPQTETPILDPSRPTETSLLCADRICLFVTTHTQVLGVGGKACRWHTWTSLTFESWPCSQASRPGQSGGPVRSFTRADPSGRSCGWLVASPPHSSFDSL
jgi:hypothetical protein